MADTTLADTTMADAPMADTTMTNTSMANPSTPYSTTAITVPLSEATIRRQEFFTQKPFPFHRLPVEIRLIIYNLAFISPDPIRLGEADRCDVFPQDKHRPIYIPNGESNHVLPRSTMEMLLLNKTVSAEIRYVLYTKNTFELCSETHRAWFSTIGVSNARCLRSIILNCSFDYVEEIAMTGMVAAFHNTLVKRVPCLTDLQYSFWGAGRDGEVQLAAEMLLDLPILWLRFRFLRTISLVSQYYHTGLHRSAARIESWLDACHPTAAGLLEQTELATKLANKARVKCRVGLSARNRKKTYTRWIAHVEPEETRPEPSGYPDIVMSSVKRHAVWKRKIQRKEKRRMETERRELERKIGRKENRSMGRKRRRKDSSSTSSTDSSTDSSSDSRPRATPRATARVTSDSSSESSEEDSDSDEEDSDSEEDDDSDGEDMD